MIRLNTMLIGTVVIGAVTVSLVIQHQARSRMRQNAVRLRQNDTQLSELVSEHKRLSKPVALPAEPQPEPTELAKLRHKVEELRNQTNELQKLAGLGRQWRRPEIASSPDSQTDSSVSSFVVSDSKSGEYKVQLYRMACAAPHSSPLMNNRAMSDARNLSRAVRFYAREHQGEFPPDFGQAADYYDKEQPLPQASDFELVFQGAQKELANIPEQTVALLRERQAWPTPSGKWARIYVMVGGEVQVVESADDFQAWEAEHVVPPPAPQ